MYLSLKWQEADGLLIPPSIPLSSEHISDSGIYLLENGEDCLIYVGSSADPDIMRQLLGISSVEEIPAQVNFHVLVGFCNYCQQIYNISGEKKALQEEQ